MNLIKAFINRCHTSLVYKYALVFLVGAIIPVLLLGLWSFWMSHRALNMHISDSVYQVLKEKIDYSTLLLQETESLIANISSVEDVSNTLKLETEAHDNFDRLRLQAKIGYILSGYINIPGLESIDIISAKGNQYHVGESSLLETRENLALVDDLIAENIAVKRSVVWHGIKKSPNDPDKYSLIASKRLLVTDPETMLERYIGIILVHYSVAAFNQKFAKGIPPGISHIILDTHGNCIYSPNHAHLGLPFKEHYKLGYKPKDNFVYTDFNGERVFLLQFTSSLNGWQYYALLHKEYLNNITKGFTRGTLIILMLILIISIVINANYIRYMLGPIKQITNALQEISEAKYDLSKKLPNTLRDEIGELIKWFNNFTENLIERESFHAELKIQKELADKANQAKSNFLASISHELRTPLNGVIVVAELLERTQLTPTQKDYLHTILQSGDILYSLINQVLDYSKLAEHKTELVAQAFDLIPFCDNLASIYGVQADIKKLRFVYEKPDFTSLMVYADQLSLQKIVINLLGNSLKFTSQGEICFQVSSKFLSEEMVSIKIAVSDTGIGIAADKQELIFQAFEQADSALAKNYEGTGLGLAIAQNLALMMNSQIMLKSPNPRSDSPDMPGSVFWLELSIPTLLDRQLTPNKISRSEKPLALCPRKLLSLIVEDNPINQKVLASVLDKYGIGSIIASDWIQCLDAMKEHSFDYIFMDIQMPGKTGLELTEIIRGNGVVTPIIAITGNALKEIEDKAYACGMNAFLVKPIRTDDLEDVILRFLPMDCSKTST